MNTMPSKNISICSKGEIKNIADGSEHDEGGRHLVNNSGKTKVGFSNAIK